MKRFTALYDELDRTTSTNAKVEAMAAYFRAAPPEDAAWALFFLTGQRPKRLVGGRALWTYALSIGLSPRSSPSRELPQGVSRSALDLPHSGSGREAAAHLGPTRAIPEWLFEESYGAVGDLAETIALLLGEEPEESADIPLAKLMEERVLVLFDADDATKRAAIEALWAGFRRPERFILNKLLTGELRVGVSHTLAVRALSKASGVEANTIAHRLMGTWTPTRERFEALLRAGDDAASDPSRPYPFYLSTPTTEPSALGPIDDFFAEWKWDGIRCQLIRREGKLFLWSRGEELMTERFPEVHGEANALPEGTVLDGEILGWDFEAALPLPFGSLQQRIGRKKLGAKAMSGSPVVFIAYDLLEHDGVDVRSRALSERRVLLEATVSNVPHGEPARLFASPLVTAESWEALAALRATSRERRVEGLMLKRKSSTYGTGRPKGDFYKWKIDPLSIDAVLLYAQPGSGRRSNLFTDYTFGVWHEGTLLPVAKAYSGLSDEEIAQLDRWIRAHTVDRFGPVRQVEAEHVFELAFEGIHPSTRHKAGIALRFPRIARWRTDKTAKDADDLGRVRAILASHSLES